MVSSHALIAAAKYAAIKYSKGQIKCKASDRDFTGKLLNVKLVTYTEEAHTIAAQAYLDSFFSQPSDLFVHQ